MIMLAGPDSQSSSCIALFPSLSLLFSCSLYIHVDGNWSIKNALAKLITAPVGRPTTLRRGGEGSAQKHRNENMKINTIREEASRKEKDSILRRTFKIKLSVDSLAMTERHDGVQADLHA